MSNTKATKVDTKTTDKVVAAKAETPKTVAKTEAAKAGAVKAEPKTEAPKKTTAKTEAPKKAAAKAEAPKKAETVKKTTVKKPAAKTAVKKAPAKPAAKATEEVFIEYAGSQVSTADIITRVVEATGKKASSIKSLNVYVQPETGKIYYTADGTSGEIAY